jgi:hypothetical protein
MSAACASIAPELVAYLDGALAEDERRPIATHVSTCLVCRREIERLTTVQRWVSDLSPIEPSRDFAAAFWERMEAEPVPVERGETRGRPWRWAIPVLAAAAGLALAVRALVPSTSSSTPSQPANPAARPPAVAAAKVERPKVAAAPAAPHDEPAQVADVDALRPEDLPPELVEHPELFLRLPVVRRLETLEHLEAMKRQQQSEGGAG